MKPTNENQKKNRYAGVAPFTTEQSDIFFGRNEEIALLTQKVKAQQQVLLYGKSGLGKSSLINAGLIPKLQENSQLQIIKVRFGVYTEPETDEKFASISPHEKIKSTLKNEFEIPSESPILDKIIKQEDSLWYNLKAWHLANPDFQFILIFDQFEELFSYSEADIYTFKKQLADVLYARIPQYFRKVLAHKKRKNPNLISDSEWQALHTEMTVKVVMAIREDRYSQMHQIGDFLPDALHNHFEISALDKNQAREAIILPAQKSQEEGHFRTAPFAYSEEALTHILDYLTNQNRQAIETTQLQILCNRIEQQVEKKGVEKIEKENDLPDFGDIFLEFYQETLAKIPDADRLSVQRFIENELIRKAQRTSIDERLCETHLNKSHLKILIDAHLLRAERNHIGFLAYELAHDTLIEPILRAKAKREAHEKEQAKAQKQAEELRIAQEKAKKDRLEKEKAKKQLRKIQVAFGIAVIFFSVAVGFGIYAFKQKEKVDESIFRAGVIQQHTQVNPLFEKRDTNFDFTRVKIDAVDTLIFKFWDITNLPTQVYQCRNLKYLDVRGNSITLLPSKIRKLKKLRILGLDKNKLNNLPSEIGELKNLQTLGLSFNDFKSLPVEIENLQNLTILWLNVNRLSIFPVGVSKLYNLFVLDLAYNQLSTLPPEISNLKKLTEIDLAHNKLNSLPPEISGLKNLTKLDLAYNQLSTLPPEISNLKKLTEIDLAHNKLNSLPSEISGLKNLTKLDLWNNQLSTLPPEISNLKKLIEINLAHNKLNSLPSEISELKNLKELILWGNNFSEEEEEKIRKLLPNCEVIFNW